MTYRKTWFSYVLWLLYSIMCVALLMYAGRVWTYYLAGMPYTKSFPDSLITPLAGLSGGLLTLIGLLFIPLTVAVYWIIRKIAVQIRKKCIWKKSVMIGFECVVVLLIMAGGIFLRAESAGFDISIAENGLLAEDELSSVDEAVYDANMMSMTYYNMAVVTQERSGTPIICYSVRELYVICLSVVMSFLGNKIASAIIMQVFLQIIGMWLVYAVTRKIAGRIPACTALLYLACSPGCLEMLSLLSYEWLFFDLYMIGMLIIVSFVKEYCENRIGRPIAIACAVLVGALIGILAYLDITAVTLLIIMVAVFTGKKHRQEDKPIRNSVAISVSIFVITFIVSVLVRGVMIGVIYGNGGMELLGSIVNQWTDLKYLLGTAFTAEYPYIYDIYLMGIVIIPAAFLVFEFFRSGREQNYMLWILICLVAASTPMAVIGSGQFGLLSLYIWSVLAGLGLQNCIFGDEAEIMPAVIEEVNAKAVSEEVNAGAVSEESNIESVIEEVDTEAEWIDLNEEPEKAEITEELEMIEITEKSEEPKKPRYFENPLPLPKKHVKREMDYQYPVEEKDMKYDVEVSEDDDFDIQ